MLFHSAYQMIVFSVLYKLASVLSGAGVILLLVYHQIDNEQTTKRRRMTAKIWWPYEERLVWGRGSGLNILGPWVSPEWLGGIFLDPDDLTVISCYLRTEDGIFCCYVV